MKLLFESNAFLIILGILLTTYSLSDVEGGLIEKFVLR